ncbi:MAG TPA: hypothetical protein EYP14_14935 [Planctomycetaceae bacterium]|nr:hypothetical protein [Planctomycetaceae bacterium]
MRCEQVIENLELFVLGELPREQADELEAHLVYCSDCRGQAEDCRLLIGQIKLLAEGATPSPSTERAVRRAVLAEIGAERSRERRHVFLAAGSAAAVLLLSASVLLWYVGVFPAKTTRPTALQPPQPRSEPPHQAAAAAQLAVERWRYIGAWAVADTLADEFVLRGQNLFLLQTEASGSYVVAVDAGTGLPRWRSEPQVTGYLTADERRVFCLAPSGTGTVQLVALDASDGKVLWRYGGRGGGRATHLCRPVPLAGERVCWTERSTVHMLDARNGKPIWIRSVSEPACLSRAEIEGDRVYVANCERLYCLSVLSGDELWAQALHSDSQPFGQPVLASVGQFLYVARNRIRGAGELICIDLASRRTLWRKSVGRVRSLLATHERIYLRADGVIGLDGGTGELLWRYEATGCGPLTLADGLIHFVDSSDQGQLVAVDQDTGKRVWEIPGIRSCDAFIKFGSTGYVKTRDGIIHALAIMARLRS